MAVSHGQRTLPGTIDDLASTCGSRTWARFPETPEAFEQGELRAVSFSDLANAINRLSWYLRERVAGYGDSETICYIGPSDIRYFILACAACKCGLKVLFSSPRNSIDAHLNLMDKTGCRTLLSPQETPIDSTAQALVEARRLSHDVVPSLRELLKPEHVEHFSWNVAFEDIVHEPFVILHTSGSTGLPKPVSNSHGLMATIDMQKYLPDIDGRSVTARRWADRSVYTALPPFHSAGINFFSYSVFQETELVLGPSDKPPSLAVVERMLDLGLADAGVMAPSLLAEVAMDEQVLAKVSNWSSVTFGGGPLPQEAGDALWQRTQVLQILGSTETFNIPELVPRSVDEWQYHYFHPSLNIDFRKHSEGLYELIFLHEPSVERHQGAFWTFPDQREYSMKDLYEPHPSKPDCWKYRGRLDDIIVLSNGEKFNPTGAERIISQQPEVKSALVVGAGQEQPAVLVEPATVSGIDPEARRNSVIEAVAEANRALPAHAQIHQSHVRMMDSPETFLRSAKGEIRRAPTVDTLRDVIEEIYKSAEQSSACTSSFECSSEDDLARSLTATLSAEFLDGKQLGEHDNLFQCGLDSLRVVKLLRHIKASLRDTGREPCSQLTPRMVYQHPTARGIAQAVFRSLEVDGANVGEAEVEDMLAEMQRRLDDFKARIDELQARMPSRTPPNKNVVLLTGSTGSLGSYILDALIKDSAVHKIVCINRFGSGVRRQHESNHSRGLSTIFHKVEFIETDLGAPCLGLDTERYEKLSQETSHVIHNAWPVNFNLPLPAFASQLEACWSLIELVHGSPNSATTTFLSSVGAANNWLEGHSSSVPEEILSDFRISEGMGYAQSKQLAELMFAYASERLDMPVSICRLGQIAGPVKLNAGMWNKQEWFPSLVLSCKALGMIPSNLGAMDGLDWIPVDLMGEMLVDAVLSFGNPSDRARDTGAEVMHFVNPHKAYWSDVVHSLVSRSNSQVQLASYEDWLRGLSDIADQENMVEEVPAVRLLHFFNSIAEAERPEFATSSAQERSRPLQTLPSVSARWLRMWFKQWGVDYICSSTSSVEDQSRL